MPGLDAFAKRYYTLIVGGMLTTVAYFQGSGISALIAEQLSATPSAPAAADDEVAAAKKKHAVTPKTKSGKEILARNPFDSETGPLDKPPPKPAVAAAEPEQAPREASNLPPKCTSGEVTLIAGALDPTYSFAVITSNNESKLRRIGDDVDGKKIEAIHGEWVVLAGAGGDDRCRLTMHDDQPKTGTDKSAPLGNTKVSSNEDAEPTRPPPSAATLAEGIRKISDTSYAIDKDAAAKLSQVKQAFLKNAKVVDGQGLRLYKSAGASVLGQLGLKRGDIVKTINGYDMTSIDQSTEVYEKLPSLSSMQIVVEREGKPVTLDYTMKQ